MRGKERNFYGFSWSLSKWLFKSCELLFYFFNNLMTGTSSAPPPLLSSVLLSQSFLVQSKGKQIGTPKESETGSGRRSFGLAVRHTVILRALFSRYGVQSPYTLILVCFPIPSLSSSFVNLNPALSPYDQ